MRPCIKLLYPLVCLQEQRRSSLEEKLRVMQASRDELQTYATQQSGLVGDLQGRNSQLTIDNDALRRRLADLQQVTWYPQLSAGDSAFSYVQRAFFADRFSVIWYLHCYRLKPSQCIPVYSIFTKKLPYSAFSYVQRAFFADRYSVIWYFYCYRLKPSWCITVYSVFTKKLPAEICSVSGTSVYQSINQGFFIVA